MNGTPIRSNTKVEQPEAVTHVGSALPFFVVDITPLPALWRREPDSGKGVQCRVVRFSLGPVSGPTKASGPRPWRYRLPRLPAQEEQGAHSFLSYSPMGKWGLTGTVSATKDIAEVRFQVNVENAGTEACDVELRTYLKDAKGKTALAFKDTRRAAGGQTVLFDRTGSGGASPFVVSDRDFRYTLFIYGGE